MRPTYFPYCEGPWPALPYEKWSDTLKTLHMWTQIMGKVRLKGMPWLNHSWHTTLYLSPNGFSTGTIPYGNGVFELELDFVEHRFRLRSSFSPERSFPLSSMSVADFYKKTMNLLWEEGINIQIHPRPNEVVDNTPFEENVHLFSYDAPLARDFWQICLSTHNVFQEFRGEFIGKSSPVHFFWGSFDLALTRFSGRPAPTHPGIAPNMPKQVMQEAYSQEVFSVGFWPGNDDFPHPVFYAYCYPTPDEFSSHEIQPGEAYWSPEMGEYLLNYEDIRKKEDPAGALRSFIRSTYEAGAISGNWDREALEKK